MVAFHVFGRPIYRYGLFYLATFAIGYCLLGWLGSTQIFKKYPGLQSLLTDKRDDLVLVALLGVVLGGRLGHVLIYELGYYVTHPGQILQVWQGGMSFIGGVIGVVLGLLYLTKKMDLTKTELFLLGDIILCIVPIGSMLGRFGNYLNQELWGLPVDQLPVKLAGFLDTMGLTHVYDTVDAQVRVNTNILQSVTEGAFITLFTWGILFGRYMEGMIRPGLITGVFFMLYGMFRFFAEFLKELPASEMRGPLSVSQRIMIIFMAVGLWFLEGVKKENV